jgi:hypothetical protein
VVLENILIHETKFIAQLQEMDQKAKYVYENESKEAAIEMVTEFSSGLGDNLVEYWSLSLSLSLSRFVSS